MKKFLLVLFALISLNTFAQLQVKEGSFKYIPGGVIYDKVKYMDGNDEPMALIKISTENINEQERLRLVFNGNLETQILKEPKTGQMWVYITAEAATFINIKHPDYGTYKYYLPEKLCEYCVYEMVLQYIPVSSEPEYGSLFISSEPEGADIYIDEKQYGKTNDVINDLTEGTHVLKLVKEGYSELAKNITITKGETLKLKETLQSISSQRTYLIVKADQADARIYIDDKLINTGEASKSVMIGTTHTYKIVCDMYHEENGTVAINERKTIEKKLRPAFGYLYITTSPEQDAKVFIDGKYLGQSPIKSDKLSSGSHTVMVMKDMFKMKEQSFTVTDGQTTNATLNMAANFVNVTINTDSNSDIYVDDDYKGKGRWTGRLSDGMHTVEARKQSHKPTRKTIDLVMGESKTITLDAPKPISGSVDINTSPMGATIYIDGKNYGETPNFISDILIGSHELKLTKQGCTTITKTINIKEGETLTVNEKLEKQSQQTTVSGQQTSGNGNGKTINGHEYVDLGLSVKWATCNVGASSPEEYGNYYAWGETGTKSSYTEDNSKTYGKSMGDIKGDSRYDAARANWGGSWRLPTKVELEELKKKCTWKWTTQNGKNGYKVTGPNGNSIFLPAAGYRYGSSLGSAGSGGDSWSSTPDGSNADNAYGLYFYGGTHYMSSSGRSYGQSVRPVTE